jgi:pyruvate dehydrogenase E1 component
VLLDKMNSTVDGEFQRYAVGSGSYIREHFFGPDPRLRAMVDHLSDDELQNLPRGGHDYRKLYAAYSAAVATRQQGRCRPSSWPRPSRAGPSARGSRAATPPTRSRR